MGLIQESCIWETMLTYVTRVGKLTTLKDHLLAHSAVNCMSEEMCKYVLSGTLQPDVKLCCGEIAHLSLMLRCPPWCGLCQKEQCDKVESVVVNLIKTSLQQ